MSKPKVLELVRFILIDSDGWGRTAGFIKDKKELALWLKDGSLEEDDVFIEVKSVFKVRKWADGSLVYEEIPKEMLK